MATSVVKSSSCHRSFRKRGEKQATTSRLSLYGCRVGISTTIDVPTFTHSLFVGHNKVSIDQYYIDCCISSMLFRTAFPNNGIILFVDLACSVSGKVALRFSIKNKLKDGAMHEQNESTDTDVLCLITWDSVASSMLRDRAS